MSRRILSAFLALVLVAGFTAVTKADVTGSFDIHILMEPEGRQTESVQYYFDIQSNLQVNITISGLTIGFDIGFGTTGIEFAIINLDTNLGALSVSDDFVFAEPFGCTTINAGNAGGPFGGQCPGQFVFNMGDGDGDGVVDNAVGFVKKRIEMELNIAGITLNNLALFEDVDFPDINGSNTHEHDHYNVAGTPYYVGQTDSVVDNQTPTFGFGDVITVSGQTVSGITVTGSTAFCASGRNVIKKRSWPYEVNKACTATIGNLIPEIEDGAKTPLLFEEETLSIEGVDLGGIVFGLSTVWHPNDPNGFSSELTAEFTLFDLADVLVVMSSTNITNLTMDAIAIYIASDNLTLELVDLGGDLQIDVVASTLALVLNPNQNPADLVIYIETGQGVGLTVAQFALGVSRGLLSLDTTTTFVGDGQLNWVGTDFELTVDYGIGFVVSASMGFTPDGMDAIEFNLGITF